jgi:hypothetical protein
LAKKQKLRNLVFERRTLFFQKKKIRLPSGELVMVLRSLPLGKPIIHCEYPPLPFCFFFIMGLWPTKPMWWAINPIFGGFITNRLKIFSLQSLPQENQWMIGNEKLTISLVSLVVPSIQACT